MYKSTDIKQSICNTFISLGYTYNFYTKSENPEVKDAGILILSKIKLKIIPDIEYSLKSIRRARKISTIIGIYSITINVNPMHIVDGYHFYISETKNKDLTTHHSHTTITDDVLLLEKRH